MQKVFHQNSKVTAQPGYDSPYSKFSDIDSSTSLAEVTLNDDGFIESCSKAATELLGCTANTLVLNHISIILPQLCGVPLVEGGRVNPYLRFLSRVGHSFEVVGLKDIHFFSAVFFNDIEGFGRHCMRIIFRPVAAFQ